MANTQEATAILPFSLHHRLALTVEHKRVTVEQMEAELGRSHNTILNYISGRTRPSRGDVNAWAQTAGVSFFWLWNGSEPDGGEPSDLPPTREYRPLSTLTLVPRAA